MILPYTLFKREKINSLLQTLSKQESTIASATKFVNAIESGNLNVTDELLDLKITDSLIHSLINMRDQMKKLAAQENERKWTNEGLAKFAEILRGTNNLAELADNLIRYIVKYLNANQGVLYLINDENVKDMYLSMTACYAYDRKKYFEHRINLGEGLAGQAVLEKATIYLSEIPETYVKITSGLGESLPKTILIVPLKLNDKIYGVIELASFSKLLPYQIQFIEKLSESLASTISSVKINYQTKKLLEESQALTEQLRSQEEELRQNMEEISATQEEMQRNLIQIETMKMDLQIREDVFTLTTILSETDLYGTITLVNDKFCEVSKFSRDELIGKPQNIVRHPDMPRELFQLLWDTIKNGRVFKGIVKNKTKDGSHYWVDATIVPIKGDKGKIIKYIGARYHIEREEMGVELYNKQAKVLGLPLLKLNYSN